jgi:hypothetical protein
MWPEYPIKNLVKRKLFLFHNSTFIDKDGVATKVSSFQEFADFMNHQNALAISVDDVVDEFEWLTEAIEAVKHCKVVCNKGGEATMIRLKFGSSSRWLVNSSMWLNRKDFDEIRDTFLTELELFFVHMETGVCITPGATGHTYMKLVWQEEHYKKETCVSLGIEKFLRDHSFGGVITTLQNGEYVELMKLDESSHFLKWWRRQPTQAGVWFNSNRVSMYKTYFAECEITIKNTLPMGLFPIRGRGNRIHYPTEEGVYASYLWKEHIDFIKEYACDVDIRGGAGWTETTDNPGTWSERIYWKRKGAPTKTVEKLCKSAAVGAIGHHGMSRIHYYLAPDDRNSDNSVIITNKEGEPLCYAVIEEPDTDSAYLLHHQRHTSSMANLDSIAFAIGFAEEGRLVQVYHDSVLIIERDERHEYIARHSNEALEQPPGTWLYEILAPCTVDKKGGVDSPQYSRHTGRKK